MVKSPKIRHSKQRNEPVTIDLSADDVKRDEAKSAAGAKDNKTAARDVAPDNQPNSSGADLSASGKQDRSAQTDNQAASGAGKDKPSTASSSFGRGATSQAKSQEAPKQASPQPKPAEPARRRGGMSGLLAGIAGGLIALLGAGALYFGGYLPAPSAAPPAQSGGAAVEQLESELAAMCEEIAALQSAPAPSGGGEELSAALDETNSRVENMAVMVEDLRGELSRLSESVAAVGGDSSALDSVQARIAEIEKAVAELPATGGGDGEALSTELADLGGRVDSLNTALNELSTGTREKFASIDEALASLGTRLDEEANDPGVALAISASALKAAIDRGQPFAAELDTFAKLAPEAQEVAALREYAATGVPTAAAIASETDAAARRIIAAARPENANAGLFDRLWASAESLITVRPIGEVEGETVPAVVARMEAAINDGDYAQAVAEYETLPEEARAAGRDFIAKVQARRAADELMSTVLAQALRA